MGSPEGIRALTRTGGEGTISPRKCAKERPCEDTEEGCPYMPQGGPSPDIKSPGTLISKPGPQSREKYLLFKPPSPWWPVIAARDDNNISCAKFFWDVQNPAKKTEQGSRVAW